MGVPGKRIETAIEWKASAAGTASIDRRTAITGMAVSIVEHQRAAKDQRIVKKNGCAGQPGEARTCRQSCDCRYGQPEKLIIASFFQVCKHCKNNYVSMVFVTGCSRKEETTAPNDQEPALLSRSMDRRKWLRIIASALSPSPLQMASMMARCSTRGSSGLRTHPSGETS